MCTEGAGAICFFERISDLKNTCEEVSTLRHAEVTLLGSESLEAFGDIGIPNAEDDTLGPDVTSGFGDDVTDDHNSGHLGKDSNAHKKEKGHGTFVDDDLADSGCGRHSYCEKCTGYCKEQAMKHYLESNFGATGGYSPKALKMAVVRIIDTCKEFGFDTGNSTVVQTDGDDDE